MSKTIPLAALPQPIADYIAANARLELEGMLKPFAADALVLDNGKRFEGQAGVRKLLEEEVLTVKAIFTPQSAREEGETIVLEGPAHGDFKGSPIHFTYRFTLVGEAIRVMEVSV